MQDDFNSMVHEMLGYSASDEIPETEFARLTSIYAYSPFIQFLYSQKLREKDPHRYAASVAKTALYFSNPHWLNHQLRNEKPAEFKTRNYHHNDSVVVETGEIEIDEILEADEHSEINIANETFDQHTVNVVEESLNEIAPRVEGIEEDHTETINDLYSSGEPTINEELSFEHTPEEITSTQPYQEEFLPDDATDIVHIEEDYERPDAIREEAGQLDYDEEDKAFSDDIASIGVPEEIGETSSILQADIELPEENNQATFESSENINVDAVITEEESPVEVVNYIDQVELPDSTNAPIDNTTVEPVEKEIPPKLTGAGELAFEPLYTIDYFASQGIKLNTEEDSKDKLTTRLKSFTDWLKSMKKIHPEKLSREIDEVTELNIKTDAEHSNDQSEILTETMAEVFLKQGLNEKALEVYEKLSLLNPSKSDYFAAKISALKAIGI